MLEYFAGKSFIRNILPGAEDIEVGQVRQNQ
jgi:hypothetical protein